MRIAVQGGVLAVSIALGMLGATVSRGGDKPAGPPAEAPEEVAPESGGRDYEVVETKKKTIRVEQNCPPGTLPGEPCSIAVEVGIARERKYRPVSGEMALMSACPEAGAIFGLSRADLLATPGPARIRLRAEDGEGRILREEDLAALLVQVAPPKGMEGLSALALDFGLAAVAVDSFFREMPAETGLVRIQGDLRGRPGGLRGNIEVAALLTCGPDTLFFQRIALDAEEILPALGW